MITIKIEGDKIILPALDDLGEQTRDDDIIINVCKDKCKSRLNIVQKIEVFFIGIFNKKRAEKRELVYELEAMLKRKPLIRSDI